MINVYNKLINTDLTAFLIGLLTDIIVIYETEVCGMSTINSHINEQDIKKLCDHIRKYNYLWILNAIM